MDGERTYAREQGLKEGIQQGIQEGKLEGLQQGKLEGLQQEKQEGKLEAKLETAANMKKMGLPLEIILQATGLTLEQVEAL